MLSIRAGSNDPIAKKDVTTDDAGTAARSAFGSGQGRSGSCGGIAVAITLVIGGSPAVAEERVAAERVLEVVSEGEPDQVDLLIYLSAAPDDLRLAVNNKAIAWRGARSGTQPSLALNKRDSLRITTETI